MTTQSQFLFENLDPPRCPTMGTFTQYPLNIQFQTPSSSVLMSSVTDSIESVTNIQNYMIKIITYYIDQITEVISQINKTLMAEQENGFPLSMTPANYKSLISRNERNIKILEKLLRSAQESSTNFIIEINDYERNFTEYLALMDQIKLALVEIDNPSTTRGEDKSSSYLTLNRSIKNALSLKRDLQNQRSTILQIINNIKYQYKHYTQNQIIFDLSNNKTFININTEEKEMRRHFSTFKDDKIVIINKLLQSNKPEIVEKLKHINIDTLSIPSVTDLQTDLSQVDFTINRNKQIYREQLSNIIERDVSQRVSKISIPTIPRPKLIPIGVIIPLNMEQHAIRSEDCCNTSNISELDYEGQTKYYSFQADLEMLKVLNDDIYQQIDDYIINETNIPRYRSIKNVKTNINISPRALTIDINQPTLILPVSSYEELNPAVNVDINDRYTVFISTNNKVVIQIPYILYLALHLTNNYNRFVILLNNPNTRNLNIHVIFYAAICLFAINNYLKFDNDGEKMIYLFRILNYYLEMNNISTEIAVRVNEVLNNSSSLCQNIIKISNELERTNPISTTPSDLNMNLYLRRISPIFIADRTFTLLYYNLVNNNTIAEHDVLLLILRTMYICADMIRNVQEYILVNEQIAPDLKRIAFNNYLNNQRNYIYYIYATSSKYENATLNNIRSKLLFGMPDFFFSDVIGDFVQLSIFYFFESLFNEITSFKQLCQYYDTIFDPKQNEILLLRLYRNSFQSENNLTLNIIDTQMNLYRNTFSVDFERRLTREELYMFRDNWYGFNLREISRDEMNMLQIQDIMEVANKSSIQFIYRQQNIYKI